MTRNSKHRIWKCQSEKQKNGERSKERKDNDPTTLQRISVFKMTHDRFLYREVSSNNNNNNNNNII